MAIRSLKGFGRFLLRVWWEILDDNVMMMAAAVAFYTCLSLAPLVVLAVSIAGLLGGDAQSALTGQFQDVIGYEGADAVHDLIEQAEDDTPDLKKPLGLLGVIVLLFAASRVFAQLQLSMNLIWDVQGKPGRIIWQWLKKRLLSMAMLGAVGFLLLVSLILSAVISYLATRASARLPGGDAWIQAGNNVVSFIVFFFVFGAIFKFLPDVKIEWRDVWFGSAITTGLFVSGKYLISLYLGARAVTGAYGAAGALVVLLLWVYYSSVVLFVGAEITQVWARRHGGGLESDVPVEGVEVDEEAARETQREASGV